MTATRLQWRMTAGLVAFSACALAPANAAELRVVTEYRYPTSYELSTVQRPGGGALVQNNIPVAVPQNFVTREVGVVMSVDATVGELAKLEFVRPTEEQKRLHGNTELMIAAASGDRDDVVRLLARGAAVNAKNRFWATALMGAATGGYDDIVTLLLDHGASTESRTKDGTTALMFAAKNGHWDVVNTILARGADVNTADGQSRTALMYAVYGGHKDVVELLLKHGANPSRPDRHGTTPGMLADARSQDDLVVLLTRSGSGN
jgi:ankyrin repeat protein